MRSALQKEYSEPQAWSRLDRFADVSGLHPIIDLLPFFPSSPYLKYLSVSAETIAKNLRIAARGPLVTSKGVGSFIDKLNNVLERGQDLPTLPAIVFEIQAAFENELVSVTEIAAVIGQDPALTARLLRVANSALMSGGGAIYSVPAAIQRLGTRQVQDTCLVLGVVRSFAGGGGLNHQEFWRHSATVGLLAQRFWHRLDARNNIPADDLYVGGLLHDIGLLLLDQFFHDHFAEVAEVHELSGEPLWRDEELVLGMDHGEVGALLLGRWALPRSIVQSVAGHHHPDTAAEEYQDACSVLMAAEAIASAHSAGITLEGQLTDADARQILALVGFSNTVVDEVLEEVDEIAARAHSFR